MIVYHEKLNYPMYTPVDVNRKAFQKTQAEKDTVKAAKLNHKSFLRAHGYNPQKDINVTCDTDGQPIRKNSLIDNA